MVTLKKSKDFKKDAIATLKGRWPDATLAWFLYQTLASAVLVIMAMIACLVYVFNAYILENTNIIKDSYNVSIFGKTYVLSEDIVLVMIVLGIIIIGMLALYIVCAMLQNGFYTILLDLYRKPRVKPKLGTLFVGRKYTMKVLGYYIITMIKVTLWSLLFVIPGIMKAFSYAMTPFVLADNPELGVSEAMRKSEEMMKGNRWRYFCLTVSFIGWSLLVMVATYMPIVSIAAVVGIYVLYVYIFVTQAAFYLEVSGEGKKIYGDESYIEENVA